MIKDGCSVPYFPLKLAPAGDGWEACNPVEETIYSLNAYARYLLTLCDGYNTYAEVVECISGQYGLEPEACSRRVAAVLDPLTEAGMVWWKQDRVRQISVPPPQSVFWELTWRCNLRCVHCVVSAGERDGREPTTQELKGIAWQLARSGVQSVAFSGGEPLYRPDFFEIAEHVAALGMSAQIATNGQLVDAEAAARLRRLNISAQITLNGASAGVHDAFTGVRGSWDKSVRAIRLLVQAGVPITVATVATKISAPDVLAIVDQAAALGVTSYRLIPFVPGGRGQQHRELELSPKEMRELTVMLREVRSSGRLQIMPLEFEQTLEPPFDVVCDPHEHIGCDGAVGYCTIGTTGEVLPCSFFTHVAADSLRHRPFRWIWANSRFLNYFRSLSVSDLDGECRSCSRLSLCRGGCRATNGSIGALFGSNAHCWLACGAA